MPFQGRTIPQLVSQTQGDIATRLPGADATVPVSFLQVLSIVLGGAFYGQYGELGKLAKQLFPTTAEKAYLRRQASFYGVYPKPAVPAQFQVTATGANGSDIQARTLFNRPADGAQYSSNEDVGVAGNTATVTVTALVPGSAGNAMPGSVLTFATGIQGIMTSVTVGAQIVAGAEAESDQSLLNRLLFRVRNPPQGGCETDYQGWALDLPEVTRAWVYPRQFGAGTVGLAYVFDGRPNIFPLPADIEAGRQALRKLRPVTADLVLYAPIPAPINPYVHIAPDTPVIRAAVTAELDDLILRAGAPGATILHSKLEQAVEDATGVQDCRLISPNVDFTIALPFMATLGQVSFV